MVRFYPLISDGGFLDLIYELSRVCASCVPQSPSLVRCTCRGARFTIVHDVEGGIRAQLLDDGGLGMRAWDLIEPILSRATVRTGGEYAVGLTMYDPALAQFGNAISPFQEMPSFEAANLAMERRPEDRYDPRYLDAPTWAEWNGYYEPWYW